MIGKKFNMLTVLEKTDKRNRDGCILYKCKCDCGNITYITTKDLKNGHKKSCGCLKGWGIRKDKKDLLGRKFGRLLVVEYVEKSKGADRSSLWKCKCECGNIITVLASSLLSGNTKSCGCISKEIIRKEGKKNNIENTNVSILKSLMKNPKSKKTKSGIKGVSWDSKRKKWRAYIGFKNKSYHLGYFDSKEKAIEKRKIAEEKLFGEFLEWYSNNISSKKNRKS